MSELVAVCHCCGLKEPFHGVIGLDNPKPGDEPWGCGECGGKVVLHRKQDVHPF